MLTIVYAFNFIDRQILVILQEPIKADMGLSDAQLGLLTGFSCALVYVTAGIPIAYRADRGNRRTAFLVVGIPGVLFAVVLRLTVKEPRRGRWDRPESDAMRPTVRETLTLLRQRPSFWYIATGTFLGGYLGDRFGVTDKRWYLWVPLLGLMASIVPYFYVLLSDHTVSVLGTLVFVNIATTLYLGPSIAMSHALVPPAMRAVASAVLFFVLNMIGLGLGPLLTGVLSDLLRESYGDQSLRYAMVTTAMVGFVAMLMFYLAARRLPADLLKARSIRRVEPE